MHGSDLQETSSGQFKESQLCVSDAEVALCFGDAGKVPQLSAEGKVVQMAHRGLSEVAHDHVSRAQQHPDHTLQLREPAYAHMHAQILNYMGGS